MTLQTFTTVKQNDIMVVIGLGSEGSVAKVSVSTGDIISTNSFRTVLHHQVFAQTCIFDREGKHIYFRIGAMVFKYPVASCGVHETYTLCLTRGQKDPLQCGWCEDRCTARDECPRSSSFKRKIIEKPKLYGIHPQKGLTSGGTKVTLLGENLGYSTETERVFSLEKRICRITEVNDNTITCITGNLVSFREDFPESIALRVGNETFVVDKTPPTVFNMTGLSQSFEYMPDPEIYQTKPGFTTISGLVNVTATGHHLNIAQRSQMRVKFPMTGYKMAWDEVEDCWSDPELNGTVITCRTPPLPKVSSVRVPILRNPLQTRIVFIMDEVKKLKDFDIHQEKESLLWYYPDPVFEDVRRIGENILEITGENFLENLPGFQIKLADGYACNITSFAAASITCDMSALASNSSFFSTNIAVEVSIGHASHQIGQIRIEQPEVETNETTSNSFLNWLIVSALFFICVLVISFSCFKHWKKKLSRRGHSIEEVDMPYIEVIHDDFPMSPETVSAAQPGNQRTEMQLVNRETIALFQDQNLLIPRSCLDIGEKVGAGQFGFVFEGFLQRPEGLENVKVAIKTIRENSWSDPRAVESFLKEGLIMKDFNHPHVLGLLGVCFPGEGPAIVLPFMQNGDLCSYIRDDAKVLLVSDLLQFAVDVATGMNYLANKKFVHRDLAARNCILDSSLRVKVADFGLSRDVYRDDYYHCEDRRAKLPCKWMAPESLVRQVYSTKTDVWSYGVLLWELMTRGTVPYVHLANCEVLEYIQLGHRLRRPEHCPENLYMVMLTCWSKDSKKRPDFFELLEFLGRLRQKILQRKKNKVLPENVPAKHTVYYNTRELDLQMDVINKDILEESCDSENEYLDMNKEPSV